jgi:hypothetical protein
MKTTLLTALLFTSLATTLLTSQTTPAVPASPALPTPTQAVPSAGANHPAIPEQMTVDDLKSAFADLSNRLAEASTQAALTKANLERQLDAWKKRAQSAESALEEAKKLLPAPAPTNAKAKEPANAPH